MKGMKRVYFRAAFASRLENAKTELRHTLAALEKACLSPQPRARTSNLHEALKYKTWWPSAELLAALNSSVCTLAMLERKTVPKPLWKAFGLVSQRWTGYSLVSRLNTLVLRARKRLEEVGESDLEKIRREGNVDAFVLRARKLLEAEGKRALKRFCEVDAESKRALETNAFLTDLERIQKNLKAAAKIKWQDYEHFLFAPRANKPIELACKLPAPSAVSCYARALEIIVDDQFRERSREEARPFLEWIARLGNRSYSDMTAWDGFASFVSKAETRRIAEEPISRRRNLTRARVREYRERKISR
jgi:hypothetical protein